MQHALKSAGIELHETLVLAGIGCSGTVQNNIGAYGYHAMHGRVLPTAIGASLAKRQLYLTISELFKRFPDIKLAAEPERDGSDHNAVVFKQLILNTNCK